MTAGEDAIAEITRLRRLVTEALWGRLPDASADFDRTRLDASIFEEVTRIRKLVFQGLITSLRRATPQPPPAVRADQNGGDKAKPAATPAAAVSDAADTDQPALRVLEGLQLFVLQHPVAAQKVFASLVAEGRRYAATTEGERWARALANSPVLRRARQLWESSLASVLDDSGDTILPSEYVEILLQGAKLAAPEELAARVSDRLTRVAP